MDVSQNKRENRFETTVDNEKAYIEYILYEDSIVLTHTVVPEKISGRGIATFLVKYAFQYAKERHLAVKPFCSFVVSFLNKHEEYREQLKLNG